MFFLCLAPAGITDTNHQISVYGSVDKQCREIVTRVCPILLLLAIGGGSESRRDKYKVWVGSAGVHRRRTNEMREVNLHITYMPAQLACGWGRVFFQHARARS